MMSEAASQSKLAASAESQQNINVQAAYLHVMGDMLMSVGVTIAATVIYIWPTQQYPWAKYIDPGCTLVFSIIVCMTCKTTLSGCIYMLMEGAPEAIDGRALANDIEALGEGVAVHDFHVWSLSRGKYSMSAHIRCHGDATGILNDARQVCQDYGIDHCTLQVEDLDEMKTRGLQPAVLNNRHFNFIEHHHH
jgi:cation diffusion facilitator family transporter